MPEEKLPPVTIENAQLIYRNFAGRQTMYNKEGDRNFHVILDPVTAEKMQADGWNIKVKEPQEEGDSPFYHLEVSIKYGFKPPKIVTVTTRGQTFLTEDTIEVLDYAEFELVDIVLNPYMWEVNGKTGIKAYLKTMFATLFEDDLEKKYAVGPAPQPAEE